jgi:phage baseplate assembly protein gpV
LNRRGDELGEVLDVVARATRFMRPYAGQVLDDADELGRGRARVSVPELGWFTATESPWMDPELPGYSAAVPPVGSWVVVRFLAGDPARPIYGARVGGLEGSEPGSLTGPSAVVLLDDGTARVTYDRESGALEVSGVKSLTVDAESVAVNGDSKAFVTHAELDAALQAFMQALNLHTHPTAASGPPSPPTVSMSLDISGAATTTVKTGG